MKKLKKALGALLLAIYILWWGAFAQSEPPTCEDVCSDPALNVSYEECIALVTLYVTNGGSSRTHQENRTTSPDVSTWWWVVLSTWVQLPRQVRELVLPANNLTGDLTSALAGLTFLERLDVQGNELTSLPASLAIFSQLEELIIAHNKISSLPDIFQTRWALDLLRAEGNQLTVLPASVGNLYELDLLDVSDNALTSLPLSIWSLDDLDILKVARNQLTVLPNPISDLDQLSLLDAQGNMLTVWPEQIEQLTTLESLQLQNNTFTTVPGAVFSLPSLHHLNLRNNLVTELPTWRAGSDAVQIVDLWSNRLITLPDDRSTLDWLTQLYLHENKLTSFPDSIFALWNLQLLWLAFNSLAWTLPNAFGQLTSLSYLDVSHNLLDHTQQGEATLPESLEERASRPWFIFQGWGQGSVGNTWLSVVDTQPLPPLTTTTITRTVQIAPVFRAGLDNMHQPTVIVGGTDPVCNQLQVSLTLQENWDAYTLQIDPQQAGVYEWCTLQLVDQWWELIPSQPLPPLIVTTEEQVDFCSDPAVTVEESTCLALLQLFIATDGEHWSRKDWWFVHPRVEERYGVQTSAWSPKRTITWLYLHSNDRTAGKSPVTGQWNGLQGRLPDVFAALPDLVNLSLGHNNLTWPLPASLALLSQLSFLYLQNNDFTWPIDTIVSQLSNLRRISVQNNKLSWVLSGAFASLTLLEAVDVRDNSFSGPLPSFSAQAPIWYLHAANNQFAWPLSASRATYTTWQHLYLQGNNLEGRIPENWSSWSGLQYIDLSANALIRDVDKSALLPSELVNRWQGRTQKNRANQKDIIAPVITVQGAWVVSGTTYQIAVWVQENNYAVDAWGAGMGVFIWWATGCAGLVATDIRVATGEARVTVTPERAGIYEDCTLTVLDHGKNYSNSVILPLLGYDLGEQSLCLHPDLSILMEECRALWEFYTATSGEQRTNKNNWWQTPQVDDWFGVQTVLVDGQEYVASLLFHRNELTSPNDPTVAQAQGNNLQGTLPNSLRNLPYLSQVRLDRNKLTWSPRDALVGMSNIEVMTLSNNMFSDGLPVHWGWFTKLRTLDLSNNQFSGSLPTTRKSLYQLETLDLWRNMLWWTIEVASGDWWSLETVDLSFNQFSGALDAERSTQQQLHTLLLNNNHFTGWLPAAWSSLSWLVVLDVSENTLTWPLPVAYKSLVGLREFFASGNTLYGDINTVFPVWTSLQKIDITANKFTWKIGNQRAARTWITTFFVAYNHLDRTMSHEAIIGSGLTTWYESRTNKTIQEQRDSSAPKLTSSTMIKSPVYNAQQLVLNREENSYAVNQQWSWMQLALAWGALCASVRIDAWVVNQQTGTLTLLLQPQQSGVYTCWLTLTDHAGNEWRLQVTPFLYDASCGDGQITSPEQCDEGRFCEGWENTECTQDDSLCPFSCVTQMVDNCTPACKQSVCGDRYVDENGWDNIAGTQDDELCDVWSFCTDGRDCTANPSICPWWAAWCQTRFTASCSPVCAPSSCGDGVVDEAWINDLLDDEDDEDCDDGNTISGDGCSSSCKVEYCGDGFVDANGKDQQMGTADDEACDFWPGNGLRAGQCDQFCKVNEQTCQRCFETCQWGTGHHSIYLLIDVSGSMEGNKMQKAKQGAIEFVSNILSGASVNSGFVSKVGLIKFSSNGTVVATPSTNYQQLITSIQSLQPWWSTNFGDPLNDARTYFVNNDAWFEKHVVLLSDGLPTVGTQGMSAEEYSLDKAAALKALWVNIYTIAVEQTEEGIEFMRQVSSSSYVNLSSWKSATQSSTQASRSAWRAVDADKWNYAQTTSDAKAWWQVDLWSQYMVREIKVWNRTNLTNDTSNFYVLSSALPFTSTNLTTTLAQSGVTAQYVTGTAQRPTTLLFDKTARYVRVQLAWTDRLSLAEVEIFGCTGEGNCDRVFSFEDYTSEAISTLYGHIFWSIHCGCWPYQVCGICGDGNIDPIYGEVCDEWSTCDDGTDCSADPSVCPTECRPRTSQTCTQLCQLPSCGDGVVQTWLGEECDDGNDKNGDGCTTACKTESCGDGIVDMNWPDQIWWTPDDEQCDDGNTENGDGCTTACKTEFCGDGIVLWTELCDTWRSCDDGTDCTTNPWICPGQCQTRFTAWCAPDCSYWYCGDLTVDGDGANNIADDSDDEQCDPGKFCPNGIPCSHDESLCPGACEVTFTPTCTQYCKTTYCGDGFVDLDGVDELLETTYDNEQCDDGNWINGDGCSATCVLESDMCGGSDCEQTCGDGTKQFFEPCDPTDLTDESSASCTDLCTLSVCGDGMLFGDEQCDEGKWCNDLLTSCTADPMVCPTWPSECKPRYKNGCTTTCQRWCGDGTIQPDGVDGIWGTADDEQCDDGNTRQSDSCTTSCKLPVCGDGIITYYAQLPTATGTSLYYETCDDGNTEDGDDCPATCVWSGVAMTGMCTTSLQPTSFYNMSMISFDDITQFCEAGIPDGSPVYNQPLQQRERICHGILWWVDASCTLSSWSCGDGVVDVWEDKNTGYTVEEACDDGNNENGDGCSSLCQFEQPLSFWSEKICASVGYPTIQPGEVVPLWREGNMEAVLSSWPCELVTTNSLLQDAPIICSFTVSRGHPDGYTEQVGSFEAPCTSDFSTLTGWALIRDALLDQGQDIQSVQGWFLASTEEAVTWFRDTQSGTYGYGQYRLALTSIDFSYCAQVRTNHASGQITTSRQTVDRSYSDDALCTNHRTVLPWYLMQQKVLFSEQPNTWLDTTITSISWASLYVEDSSYNEGASSVQYTGPEKSYLFDQIIEKYRPLATEIYTISTANDSVTTFKKVPNSNVFVYTEAHDLMLEWSQIEYLLLQSWVPVTVTSETPFTLIIPDQHAELQLIWNIPWRGMYVARNDIAFIAQNCDTNDIVQWLFVTNGQFTTTATLNNTSQTTEWCNKWWLRVDWLLLWGNISVTLAWSRRSTLDLWDNETKRYASEENASQLADQLYRTCYEIPLIADIVYRVLWWTWYMYGWPFAWCLWENTTSFKELQVQSTEKLVKRLFTSWWFFDRAFHEQNTLPANTLLNLLSSASATATTSGATSSLVTKVAYSGTVYTIQIPAWKIQQITAAWKTLPVFWTDTIDLHDTQIREQFIGRMNWLVWPVGEYMRHLDHPLWKGDAWWALSLHKLFEKHRWTSYTEHLLGEVMSNQELCTTSFLGGDGYVYTNQRDCLLSHTPLYKRMTQHAHVYATQKTVKDTHMLDWAGVQVRSAPFIRQSPPPGSRDLLQAMQISF